MGKFSKIDIRVPDLNRAYVHGTLDYSKASVRAGNLAILKKIIAADIVHIRKWGRIFEIDPEIGVCFEAAESGGVSHPPNGFGATGKWQVTAPVLAECVPKWTVYQKQPLPSEAVNFLNSRAGFITKLKRDVPLAASQKSTILQLLQSDSEFNIMVGMMYLRWLLEKFKVSGVAQLNKAMVGYNAGAYNAVIRKPGAIDTSSLVVNKGVPVESRAYLLKLLGASGFLDIIFTEKLL